MLCWQALCMITLFNSFKLSGQYCIYQMVQCPTAFTSGYVYWDDDDYLTKNGDGGTLPKDEYDDNTKIYFCCKTDGDKDDPILLPSKSPFYLLAYESAKCQKVKWAVNNVEWIKFDTEHRRNADDRGGAYPHEAGKTHPTIYYCYYRGCNETLTTVNGTFQSPNFPKKYPDGQYCSWRITVNTTQQIQLMFTNFSLQNENNTDELFVYDGENATREVLGVFYGGHPPPKEGIYSSSNQMFLIFKSDTTVSRTGFNASYSAVNKLATTQSPEVTTSPFNSTKTLRTLEKITHSTESWTPTTGGRSDRDRPQRKAIPAKQEKLNKDIIYGSVIGVLAFLLIVFAIYLLFKRLKRQREDRLEEMPVGERVSNFNEVNAIENVSTTGHHDPNHYMALREARQSQLQGATDPETTPFLDDYAPLHPGTRSWEVPRENIIIEKIIGSGSFGNVAQGKASQLRGTEETTKVAIKMLKDNAPESDRKDLLSELEVMKKLKPHPHVIKLLGCVTHSDPLLVIIEYVPYGDLVGYLRKSRGLNDTYFKDPDVKPQTSLTSQQLVKFSWQIADGMHYLSSRNIIHRDLAARNVLVGEQERCKVTDFGMARDVQEENIYEKKSKGRLPVKWTAYEGLLYGRYTTKSDIWSFGIVLYEVFTIGGSPYPRIDGRKMADLLCQGYRMPKPKHVDDVLYEIMLNCWQEDPDGRPTFENLTVELKEMEKQHKKLINMQDYDKKLYENVEDLMF